MNNGKHGQGTSKSLYQNGCWQFGQKIPQIPQNLSAHFVCPSPKVLDFNEKRLHWASVVHGLIWESFSILKKWCRITTLLLSWAFISKETLAQASDLAHFLEDEAEVKHFLRLNHHYQNLKNSNSQWSHLSIYVWDSYPNFASL